jgi:hypothetical protein
MTTEVGDLATLYLRGVPAPLVREAKVAAARRGITLTALVAEALARCLDAAPPGGEELPADLQAEKAWYEAHQKDLAGRYRGQYVAIVDQRVVDHDKAFGPLANRVFARFGVRPIFMPRCLDGDRVANLPSPRIARR